jgi:hypothetical protein
MDDATLLTNVTAAYTAAGWVDPANGQTVDVAVVKQAFTTAGWVAPPTPPAEDADDVAVDADQAKLAADEATDQADDASEVPAETPPV